MSQNLIANLLSTPATGLSNATESGGNRPARGGQNGVDAQDPVFMALLAMMQGGSLPQGAGDSAAFMSEANGVLVGTANGVGAKGDAAPTNPMSPTELPERLKAAQEKSARGVSGAELLEKAGIIDRLATGENDGLWDGVEIEGMSDFDAGAVSSQQGKAAQSAKHALFSGSDFIAMKSASRPKLKDDAMMADRKISMQAIDSLGMSQMLRAEAELGSPDEKIIGGDDQAPLFGHLTSASHDKPLSNAFVGGQSLEMSAVPGSSNEKYALKTESVKQLAQQIGNIRAQGAETGEIRLRLRPDHLGELRVQVKAEGRQVALRFEAKDDRVKAALESAVSDLRERLQSQNLNLGSVDVQVSRETGVPVALAANTPDFSAFDGNQQSSSWMNSHGQSSGQGRKDDSGFESFAQDGLSRSRLEAAGRTPPSYASRSAAGRIDLRA